MVVPPAHQDFHRISTPSFSKAVEWIFPCRSTRGVRRSFVTERVNRFRRTKTMDFFGRGKKTFVGMSVNSRCPRTPSVPSIACPVGKAFRIPGMSFFRRARHCTTDKSVSSVPL